VPLAARAHDGPSPPFLCPVCKLHIFGISAAAAAAAAPRRAFGRAEDGAVRGRLVADSGDGS
jgi:hypothetical protein